jgi:RNA polymerase sigma factor (sigma-70 family)
MNDLLEPPPDDGPGRVAPAIDQPSPEAPAPPAADVAAFTAFYRGEIRALVAFLLYLGASLPDAADLAQETMIDAYRGWAAIAHPRAWTRSVASRKYGRRVASAEAPVDLVEESPLLPAHHDVTDWDQRHHILQLLAGLPWRQRQVMAWTFDGHRPHEIAAELNITPQAVRSSLKLARRALAAQLDQAGDDLR